MTFSKPVFIIEEKAPPWKEAVALLCTKCYLRLSDKTRSEELEDLRSWLKNKLKEDGYWDRLRVLTTGCQSFCPAEGISMVLQRNREPRNERVWILSSLVDRESLYRELIRNLLL